MTSLTPGAPVPAPLAACLQGAPVVPLQRGRLSVCLELEHPVGGSCVHLFLCFSCRSLRFPVLSCFSSPPCAPFLRRQVLGGDGRLVWAWSGGLVSGTLTPALQLLLSHAACFKLILAHLWFSVPATGPRSRGRFHWSAQLLSILNGAGSCGLQLPPRLPWFSLF